MKKLLSSIAVLVFLSSCGTIGATVTSSKAPALDGGVVHSATAKSYRIVLVTRANTDGAPVPMAGESLYVWNSMRFEGSELVTGNDGSVQFSCRCDPQIFYRGVLMGGDRQQDDDLQNLVHVLVEVK